MKLKTLKDIEHIPDADDPDYTFLIPERKLRQEAIKRVKNCTESICLLKNHDRCIACKRDIRFYNLTEEDLK